MKKKKQKKAINKFGLEKFEVAKLKNLHLITGGGQGIEDDPIDGTGHKGKQSTGDCHVI